MSMFKALSKDHLGAALLIAMGAGAFALGMTYRTGTLNHMGAGFVPVVLGALMVLVGLAVGLTATPAVAQGTRADPQAASRHVADTGPQWRGWLCILGGVLAFVVLGEYGGLVPASFAAVFISALGDRANTVRSAAVLALVIDVFGVIVFHYGLHIQLALFRWG